jgi:hypothetical protein
VPNVQNQLKKMPNQAFNADSLQRGICFANYTPRCKPLRRQAGSALPVNLALCTQTMNIDTRPQKLTNLDIARHQIDRAVLLFLDKDDYISSLTLAGAAEEILGAVLRKQGKAPAIENIVAKGAEIQKTLYGIESPKRLLFNSLNEYRNKLKHFNEQEPLHISPGYYSSRMLNRAIENYVEVCSEPTETMNRFLNTRLSFDFTNA